MSHEARRTAALPPRREKAHVRRVTEHPDGWFRRFACSVSDAVGSYWAFVAALGVVLVWAITGPVFVSEDAKEGANAFKEKREPAWQGR